VPQEAESESLVPGCALNKAGNVGNCGCLETKILKGFKTCQLEAIHVLNHPNTGFHRCEGVGGDFWLGPGNCTQQSAE